MESSNGLSVRLNGPAWILGNRVYSWSTAPNTRANAVCSCRRCTANACTRTARRGGGIRRCIGLAFAIYEMKMVLATVLREKMPSLETPGTVRIIRRSITFAPKGGVPVLCA